MVNLIPTLVLLFVITFAQADESNSTMVSDRNDTYVNIVSNLDEVSIFVDGKFIGMPPIANYLISPNMEHNITAVNDDMYHEKNITKTITVPRNNLRTIEFMFEPLKTEVFLVGEDGDLYINGDFHSQLHSSNRVIKLDASESILFGIYNKNRQTQFARDLQGGEFTQIKYNLFEIPKEIALFTTNLGNMIWEDTKDAANQNREWAAAERYCRNLEIAYLKDWRLPTIKELNFLYENYRDKIYNGHGGPFYWSNESSEDKSGIWQYSQVKDFIVDGEVKRSIKEFGNGKVRCIHGIEFNDMVDTKMMDEDNTTELDPGELDPNLTKDLQRFMLK